MSAISPNGSSCSSREDGRFGPVTQFCRDGFDFTIAFEQYFFVLAPAACLILAAPLRLRQLVRRPAVVANHTTWLTAAKRATNAIFALLQLALIILWAQQPMSGNNNNDDGLRIACVAASGTSFAASLALSALSYLEHARSLRPSLVLNVYLLASLVLDCAVLRTFWLAPVHAAIRAVYTASFCLRGAAFVLEATGKRRFVLHERDGKSAEALSGLCSQALLWWINPLLVIGYRRLLRPGDLYVLDEGLSTRANGERFWKYWNPSNGNLIRTCMRALKRPILFPILPRLFLLGFTVCQPLVLEQVLSHLEHKGEPARYGHGLVAAYGLVYFGTAVSTALYRHRLYRLTTTLRGVLISAVFTKSTQISVAAANNAASATLMSVDVETIVEAAENVHEFWAMAFQVALAMWLLSRHIGISCLGPLIVCAVALAATLFLGPLSKQYMHEWMQKVEERIGAISSVLGQIKNIKMSGLSQTVYRRISRLRSEEIKAARPTRTISAISSSLMQMPQMLSPVLAFALYGALSSRNDDGAFNVTRVFTSLSLIIFIGSPLFTLIKTIISLNTSLACLRRVERFLAMEARADTRLLTDASSEDPIMVRMEKVSLGWSKHLEPTLEAVDLCVEKGQLVVVAGPVASGKSTLLRGILGEVSIVSGSVTVSRSKLAWCEQAPWLTDASIKNNITGFNDYDPELYKTVIHALDLGNDVGRLPDGHETVIGSKGIRLSGGQRARVAIARAVYSRAQIMILDDVFASLDNRTARKIFERLFKKDSGLLRQWGTTIILASSQPQVFLDSADQFLVLKGGIVSQEIPADATLQTQPSSHVAPAGDGISDENDGSSSCGPAEEKDDTQASELLPQDKAETDDDKRRQTGDSTVYRFFFIDNVGVAFSIGLLLAEIVWAFLSTFPTVWLKWWTDADKNNVAGSRFGYYLGGYAGLQTAGMVEFGLVVWFALVMVAAKAGSKLHGSLLHTIMSAPLSFYTSTEIGSVVTRFAQDISLIDRLLPFALFISLGDLFTAIAQAILIAVSTAYLAISYPFQICILYFLQKGYLRTSRQLRLLDLEEKAPVFSHFLQTIDGLATTRAFDWTEAVLLRNHTLVDNAQKPFYLLLMVQQWLTLVLDLMVTGIALLVVGISFRLRDSISAGLTGVALVQLISFAETLQILIRFWTTLETSIGAVQRVKDFSEKTPGEDEPSHGEHPALASGWPAKGSVQFDSVSASYGVGDGVSVLDSISLTIEAGQKISICGRTGSGKSSILLALVRMLDLSSGTIRVDGVDISTLPREEVRKRLICVTQDALVLSGTIRFNLDPLGIATDQTIHDALSKVGLLETIMRSGGLDGDLEETTLSHGEKQLMSLARAVLRKGTGKIVLLDEVTSSLDATSEARVQRLIREEFSEHTVIAISHRLGAVADFDQVLELKDGGLVEISQLKERG
ncbi:P-loop containing nucleoside triphosphate hydrolase protein [Apiospora arundinis]